MDGLDEKNPTWLPTPKWRSHGAIMVATWQTFSTPLTRVSIDICSKTSNVQ